MSTSDSYIIEDAHPESSNDQDEIDSLPSSVDSSDLDSEDESDAQKEWEASLQQLEMMLTMVVVPWVGKYFGRKVAYWSKTVQFWILSEWLLMMSACRLGQVYDLEVSCGGRDNEQGGVQRGRCCRSRRFSVMCGIIADIAHINISDSY
jgi:hypothetical protein